jgi:putative transposase
MAEYDLLLSKFRESVRLKRKQKAAASLGIVDSQTVRWGNNKSLSGIDGNKKVKGIKRHVVVNKNGFLIAVMVTVANIHDSKAAYLLMRVLKELRSSVKTIIADGGLQGKTGGTYQGYIGICITGNNQWLWETRIQPHQE